MDPAELARWRDSVTASMAEVLTGFEERMGFPPGDDRVEGPAPGPELAAAQDALGDRLPESLRGFHRNIGEVCLPDFWNGLFIAPLSWIVATATGEGPRRITGAADTDVTVFATDGGGAMFALGLPEGRPVFRLPPAGLSGGRYEADERMGFRVVADDLDDFLELVDRELADWAGEGLPPTFF